MINQRCVNLIVLKCLTILILFTNSVIQNILIRCNSIIRRYLTLNFFFFNTCNQYLHQTLLNRQKQKKRRQRLRYITVTASRKSHWNTWISQSYTCSFGESVFIWLNNLWHIIFWHKWGNYYLKLICTVGHFTSSEWEHWCL